MIDFSMCKLSGPQYEPLNIDLLCMAIVPQCPTLPCRFDTNYLQLHSIWELILQAYHTFLFLTRNIVIEIWYPDKFNLLDALRAAWISNVDTDLSSISIIRRLVTLLNRKIYTAFQWLRCKQLEPHSLRNIYKFNPVSPSNVYSMLLYAHYSTS